MERRDEDEGSAECQEKVSWCVAVIVQFVGSGQTHCSDDQTQTANDAAYSRAVGIEDSADGKGDDVSCDGSDSEHQVEAVDI